MKATIGRMVHYHSYGTPGGEYLPEQRAAVITEIRGNMDSEEKTGHVSLAVFGPSGMFFNIAPFSEKPKPGHWNWPPRT